MHERYTAKAKSRASCAIRACINKLLFKDVRVRFAPVYNHMAGRIGGGLIRSLLLPVSHTIVKPSFSFCLLLFHVPQTLVYAVIERLYTGLANIGIVLCSLAVIVWLGVIINIKQKPPAPLYLARGIRTLN